MIKNERQYRITLTQAEKFRTAIAAAKRADPPPRVHPRLHQASIDGMRSQLETLERELRAYEQLKSARGKRHFNGRFDDLATLLISARIARGWSQRELAERLGLHMQKIQQYEAGGYERASLTRIGQILQALGATVDLRLDLVVLPAGFVSDLKATSSTVR